MAGDNVKNPIAQFMREKRTALTRHIKHVRFLAKAPKSALRMANGFLRARILKQSRVRNCQMALTFTCNHSCKMCSSNLLLHADKKDMTLEQWCAAVDQLKELGCTHFDLTGGEPTLRGLDFLAALISHITKDRDSIVSIATNGKIIDEHWLRALNSAGLNSMLLNIQSLRPGVHDEIAASPGNLEKIKTLIPLAKKVGLNVCINTCLGSYNIDDIRELVVWCGENDLFTLINLATPTGRLVGQDVRMTKFQEEYYRMLKTYPMMRSDTSYNYRGQNLCPGGIEKLYITTYGDVIQCTFCQISFGNILKTPLTEIYKRFTAHPLIKKRDICKHSFNTEFRKEWIEPICAMPNVPVPLEQHPNYCLYCKPSEP